MIAVVPDARLGVAVSTSVELFKRWWVRVPLYAALIAAAAWSAYHLAYRHYGGPNPRDSGKDLAMIYGAMWATGLTVAASLAAAIVESFVLLRRSPD